MIQTSPQTKQIIPTIRPWYREFYVWMVIAGPVSAVLACAVTAVYILQGPDAVVSENYYREGLALAKEVAVAQPAMQPARTGRNHSATGGDKNVGPNAEPYAKPKP